MKIIKDSIAVFDSGRKMKLLAGGFILNESLELYDNVRKVLTRENDLVNTELLDPVYNPHMLTNAEVLEIAEYMLGLWWQFRKNVQQHGVQSVAIFRERS